MLKDRQLTLPIMYSINSMQFHTQDPFYIMYLLFFCLLFIFSCPAPPHATLTLRHEWHVPAPEDSWGTKEALLCWNCFTRAIELTSQQIEKNRTLMVLGLKTQIQIY